MAIRAAQYDLILSIEANSYVKDRHWIRSMIAPYGNGKELVLGHVTHPFCSKWIRCDFLQCTLHYMGRAAIGWPYTGTGANLLFKKSLFYDNNGLNVSMNRDHFPDRVLIREVVAKDNCAICVQPSGVTHFRKRLDVTLWRRYRNTERRSLVLSAKSPRYPMLAESIIRLLFYGVCVTCLALLHAHLVFVLIFSFLLFSRLLLVLLLYLNVRKKLDDTGLAVPFLLWDIAAPFVYLFRVVRP